MGKKDKVYKIGNDVYDIPENEVNSFLKENPKAVEVQSYKIGTDTFDIPSNEVPQFLKENPSAKQLGKELPAPQVPRGSGVSISEGGTSGLGATTSDYLTFQAGEEGLGQPKTNVEIPLAPGGPQPKKKAPQVQKKEEESAFLPKKGKKFESLRLPTEEELIQEEQKDIKEGRAIKVGNKVVYPSGTKKEKIKVEGAEFYPETFTKESPLGNTSKAAQDPINIERERSLKTILNSFDEFKLSTGQQQLNEDDEAKNFYLYYLQKNNPEQYKYESERINYNKDNPLESQKIQVELINKGLTLKQQALSAKAEEINNVLSDKFLGYDEDANKLKDVNSQINSIVPRIEEINKELSSYPKDQNGNIIVNETNKRKVEKLISDYKVERQKYDNLIGQRNELLNSDFGTLIKKADELAQEDRKNYEYALNLEKKIKESNKFPELKKKLIEDAIKQEEDAKSWKETPEWVKWGVDTFSGIQRAGTELLKGIAFLPKAFGEKSGYGITDKISEYVDDSLTKYEEFAAPLSPDAKKDIFDYERNPDGTPKLDENGEKIEVTNWSALPYQLSNGAANLGLFIVSGGAGTALESANVLSKIGLGVKGASALNKAGTFAMGYTMSAKGNYDEAKSVGMTETQAISYSKYKTIPDALVELIFPEQKLITPTYKKESAKLAAKYISDGVSVKDAVVRASKELLGKVGGENIEELSALGSDYVSKLVAEKATGVDFKVNDDLMNKIKSTVLVTTILTTPFGLVGAKGTKNQMQSQSLFLAANKPNQVISDINELVDAKVITEEQAKVAREKIEIASEALNTIPKEYSDDKKATALSLLVDKKILENKKKEIDPVFHENIDAQIKEKDDEIKKDVNRPDNGLTLEQNDELEDLTFKKENGVITETEQKQLDELNKFVEDYAKPKVKTVTKTMVAVEFVPEGQRFPMVATIPKEEFEAFKQANPTANIVYEKEVEVKEEVGEEPKVEQEIKKQEDAIQEQTTGQVLVQPEAEVGGKMEEGKPQAAPQAGVVEGEVEKELVRQSEQVQDILGVPSEEADVLSMLHNADLTPEEKQILYRQYKRGVMNINDVKNYAGVMDLEKLNSEDIGKWARAALKKQKSKSGKFNAEDIDFEEFPKEPFLKEQPKAELEVVSEEGVSTEEKIKEAETKKQVIERERQKELAVALEDAIKIRKARNKEDLDAALMSAFNETTATKAINAAGMMLGKDVYPFYLNKDYSFKEEVANEIEKIQKKQLDKINAKYDAELNALKSEAEPTAEEKTIKQKAEELNKKIDAATEKLKNAIVDKNANNRLFSAPMITPKMISDLIDLSSAVIKKSITAGATIAQAVNDGINAIKNHPRYKRFVEAGQINEENFEKQIRDNYADLIKEEETKAQEEAKKKEEEAKKEVPPAKPPVTTEAEKKPAPEGKKERATATRILENKKFHEDVVKRLSNEAIFYEPTSVNKSEEFVNAVIDEYEANGKLDDLVNEYMADKSDVIPDNQKLLFGDFLTKKLEDIATKEQNEFVRETLFDKAEQVFEKTAKNTTTAAQQLALIRNRDTRMFSNEIYMRRYAKKQFSEMQDNAMSEAQKNDIKSAQEIIDEYRKSNEFTKEVEQATAEELKKIAETREGAGKVKQFNDIIDSLKVNLSDC